MTVRLTKSDVLSFLRQDCERALKDAETRLTEDTYDVDGHLWSSVDIKVAIEPRRKLGKHFRVGHAVNARWWESEGAA